MHPNFQRRRNDSVRPFHPPRGMAALLMHQALVMDVEAGVPPMTAIQSATINVAKTFGKDKDYGSVEVGKVADLSIIEGDPLDDIWMTQNVKMVVMDGKVIDIGTGTTKERNYAVAAGSLVLARPLRFDHAAGEPVVAVDDTLFVSVDRAAVKPSSRGLRVPVVTGMLRAIEGRNLACGEDVTLSLNGSAVVQPSPSTTVDVHWSTVPEGMS